MSGMKAQIDVGITLWGSRRRDLDSVAEIDAAGQLEALGLLLQERPSGAREGALAAASPGADLPDPAAAHLQDDPLERERQGDRELETREEHLLGEYLDRRMMRGGDRMLGEREQDRLLGRILRLVPVLLELAVLLPATEEYPHDVHVENLGDLGLDLLGDRSPFDTGQLAEGLLELGAGVAPLDRLSRIFRPGEKEIPQRQRTLSHRLSDPPRRSWHPPPPSGSR